MLQEHLKNLDKEIEKWVREGMLNLRKYWKPIAAFVTAIIIAAILDTIFAKEREYGSITHGGKTYKTIVIGTQTWMAENLNYEAKGSKCYDNDSKNCYKYGRLYDWVTAMALPGACYSSSCPAQIQEKHKGICPAGWHLPTNMEWDKLIDVAGGQNKAGKHLKAVGGWDGNGNGTDKFGFAALPGGAGSRLDVNFFSNIGYSGFFWSATEFNAESANNRYMYDNEESVGWRNFDKTGMFSVRCVRN